MTSLGALHFGPGPSKSGVSGGILAIVPIGMAYPLTPWHIHGLERCVWESWSDLGVYGALDQSPDAFAVLRMRSMFYKQVRARESR